VGPEPRAREPDDDIRQLEKYHRTNKGSWFATQAKPTRRTSGTTQVSSTRLLVAETPTSKPGPQSIRGLLGTVSGTILAAVGIVSAATDFQKTLQAWIPLLAEWPRWVWWLIFGGLIVVGSWQVANSRKRRSELLRPEVLRLERDNPEHLVGREDDRAELVRKCESASLVRNGGSAPPWWPERPAGPKTLGSPRSAPPQRSLPTPGPSLRQRTPKGSQNIR
jgi:hypothetical protein